jgi:hypothetical protein
MHAEICQAMMLPGRRHRRRLHYQSRTVRFFYEISMRPPWPCDCHVGMDSQIMMTALMHL